MVSCGDCRGTGEDGGFEYRKWTGYNVFNAFDFVFGYCILTITRSRQACVTPDVFTRKKKKKKTRKHYFQNLLGTIICVCVCVCVCARARARVLPAALSETGFKSFKVELQMVHHLRERNPLYQDGIPFRYIVTSCED
jgi:hypothetical protein